MLEWMPSSQLRTVVIILVVGLVGLSSIGIAAPTTPVWSVTAQSGTPDAVIEDGGSYWVGQTLESTGWTESKTVELQLQANGSWRSVSELEVDDGAVVVDTDRLDAGSYRLVADDGGRRIGFDLDTQQLDVVAAPDTVDVTRGENPTTNFTVSSNRDGYSVAVSSPDLEPSKVRDVLDRGKTADVDGDGSNDAVVIEGVQADATVAANFSETAPGNVTLDFAALDTTARGNTTVTVERGTDFIPTFNRSVIRAMEDGLVRITVDTRADGEPVTVRIGGEEHALEYEATIEDDDGDGRAVLVWNTTTAQTATAALRAGPGTTLVEATDRHSDTFTNATVEGDYALSVYDGASTEAPETGVAVAVTDPTNADDGPPPNVEIVDVDEPTQVDSAGEYVVDVAVENTGGIETSAAVRIRHDSENVSVKTVTLGPNESTTVPLQVTVEAAGTNRFVVVTGDDITPFEVRVEADATAGGTETTAGSAGGTASGASETADNEGMPGFGVLSVLLGLSVLTAGVRARD